VANGPTKRCQVADGGPPVLTSAERAAKEYEVTTIAGARRFGDVRAARRGAPAAEALVAVSEQEVAADPGRIGPAALPPLIQALQSPDAVVRLKRSKCSVGWGPMLKTQWPQLVQLLSYPTSPSAKPRRTLGQSALRPKTLFRP